MKRLRQKKGYGVSCVRRGLNLCRFPAELANYSDMSAEVHVQAQISPFFCSQVVFRLTLAVGPTNEGQNICSKGLSAWACLLGKNVHFLKALKARCLDSIWVSEVIHYNLQRCSAKFYGLGCWGWAVVNSDRWEVNKTLQASPEGPGRNLFRWKCMDIEIIIIRITREGSKKT